MNTFKVLSINDIPDNLLTKHKKFIEKYSKYFGQILPYKSYTNGFFVTNVEEGVCWPKCLTNTSYIRESTQHAVVDFWITKESTLNVQVVKMDELFRSKDGKPKRYELAGYEIISSDRPELKHNMLQLWGNIQQHDNMIVSCKYLSANSAQAALNDFIQVLKHWSSHWDWTPPAPEVEMRLVNCTGHPINICKDGTNIVVTIPPTEYRARVVNEIYRELINGFAAECKHSPVLHELPDPEENTLYIVSSIVYNSSDRVDLIVPDTGKNSVKDDKGNVMHIKKFQTRRRVK